MILALAVGFVAVAVAAFAAGRATVNDDASSDRTDTGEREFVGRVGDVIRVPSVGVYCTVDVEASRPRFLCTRLAGTRGYDVSFERNRTVVVRVGDPGDVTTFPEER